MIKINFLPWREASQRLQRRNFIYGSILVLLIVLIIVLCMCCELHKRIAIQVKRNKILRDYNEKLNSKKQQYMAMQKRRNLLIDNLHLIIKMQHKGQELVQVLQVLFSNLDDGYQLDAVILQDNLLTIKFTAKNYYTGDKIARLLAGFDFLTKPKVNLLVDDYSLVKFVIDCSFKQGK